MRRKPLPQKSKETRDKIMELRAAGTTVKECAKILGIGQETVRWHIRSAKTGKCKSCIYQCRTNVNNCDYIVLTGRRRGCPPGPGCTAYKKIQRKAAK